MRVCNVHGCGTMYPASEGGRCPAHRLEARRARVSNTVYSTRGHRTFRDAVLTRDVVCVACEVALATVADHYPRTRIELVELGLNANDPQHGRGLCARCHNKWTAVTSPGGFMG